MENEMTAFLNALQRPTLSPALRPSCSVPGGDEPECVSGEDDGSVHPVAASATRRRLQGGRGVSAQWVHKHFIVSLPYDIGVTKSFAPRIYLDRPFNMSPRLLKDKTCWN